MVLVFANSEPTRSRYIGLQVSGNQSIVKKKILTLRYILPLSLSYDHRVLMVPGALFVRRLSEILNDMELINKEQ